MSQVTMSQVHKVQKLSKYARAACSLLLALLALSCAWVAIDVIGAPGSSATKFTVGRYVIRADQLSSGLLKTWLLVVIATGGAISAGILYLLRRVFDNMARGEIFSAGNVRHIRSIGAFILAVGVLQFTIPAINALMHAMGAFDAAFATITPSIVSPGVLVPFGVAGLIFLVSWIMAVGLGVSEEATELRRDAELVV